MKKNIHSITLNVFEKKEETIEEIRNIYHSFLPIDFQKENVQIREEKLEGLNKNIIHSLTLETTRKRHNNLLFDTLFHHISTQDIELILKQIESRLNAEGHLFIRLEKKALLQKQFFLTDGGDCFHIKIKIAGYPAKREIFIETVKSLLEPYKEKQEEK